jgi:hypothetical protein
MKRCSVRIALATLVAFAIAGVTGCASVEQARSYVQAKFRSGKTKSQMLSSEGEMITQQELAAMTSGFADRYMTYISDACEQILKDNKDTEQRRRAHQVRLVQTNSIYDIVTNADPFTQLLDLTLVVTLQSTVWIDEDQADAWFGDRAPALISASRRAREDIWKIAGRVMKPDQLEVIDHMIFEWRQKNPDVQMVSYVRFDDFSAARGKSVVADVKGGGGLLAPVGEATKAVDEVRLLGERAFYLGKRMPFLVNWQVESAVDNVVNEPNIKGVADSVQNVTRTIDRLPQDIARERQSIFAELDRKRPMINAVFTQYRGAIGETDKLVGSVQNVANATNELMQQLRLTTQSLDTTMGVIDKTFLAPGRGQPKPANEKPFDIEDYTRSVTAVTAALREANQLLSNTSGTLDSSRPDSPLKRVSLLATDRIDYALNQSKDMVDRAFWRAAALIVLFFVLLGCYRMFSVRVGRRAPASGQGV